MPSFFVPILALFHNAVLALYLLPVVTIMKKKTQEVISDDKQP